MPNAEALAHYRHADIVIDQLLVGWYGVLAMEAMALGKTVICYIRSDLSGYFGESMPILNANPDTITSVLRDAIQDTELRREVARRGRAFVETVHDSRIVAGAAAQLYQKILQAPVSAATPNFAYLLGHSREIQQHYVASADWHEQLASADAARRASEAEVNRLRYPASRYEELKADLPALRYRAQRYDEVKDQLAMWRSKAERFDELSWERPVKAVLSWCGFSSSSHLVERQASVARNDPLVKEGSSSPSKAVRPKRAKIESKKDLEMEEKDNQQTKLIAKLNKRDQLRLEYIHKLEAERDRFRWERDFFSREQRMTTSIIGFARGCEERATELAAEVYIAHGVQALLAVDAVARRVGGRVYADVVEMPSLAERSVAYDIDLFNIALLDHAFASFLRGVAGITTIGWALKEKIAQYGPRVTVIPNYRNAEEPQPSAELREQCGIGPHDHLLLASSTISSGFEPIVEALAMLPDNVHLATLGTIVREYRPKVDSLVERLNLSDRVHFFDPVPYQRLTAVSSGASLGLMAIDPSLTNDRVSLPNRLFDCIAAGLPIVTPDVPDIARIVRERRLGVALPENTAAEWMQAIKAALADEPGLRINVLTAAKELVWESLADDLLAAYGHPTSVTIVSLTDLTTHQRTLRMTDTFLNRGVKVTVCCAASDQAAPAPVNPGANYVFIRRGAPVPSGPTAPADSRGARRPAQAPDPAAKPQLHSDGAVPILKRSEAPRLLSAGDELALGRLKKEVMALRYKARRYDEIKEEVVTLRAKAAGYDLLCGKPMAALRGVLRRRSK
jgi:glycosyltransferase involved in cell wall biosynthesis